MSSICDQYILYLKNPRTKYDTVTANDLMKHLWTTYRKVDIANITANESRLKTQWAPPPLLNISTNSSQKENILHHRTERIFLIVSLCDILMITLSPHDYLQEIVLNDANQNLLTRHENVFRHSSPSQPRITLSMLQWQSNTLL